MRSIVCTIDFGQPGAEENVSLFWNLFCFCLEKLRRWDQQLKLKEKVVKGSKQCILHSVGCNSGRHRDGSNSCRHIPQLNMADQGTSSLVKPTFPSMRLGRSQLCCCLVAPCKRFGYRLQKPPLGHRRSGLCSEAWPHRYPGWPCPPLFPLLRTQGLPCGLPWPGGDIMGKYWLCAASSGTWRNIAPRPWPRSPQGTF